MKKFNHEEFDIEPEIETGNEGQAYGNYVNWDEFRTTQEEEILEYFDIYLPWDEKICLEDYMRFLNQPLIEEFPELLTEDCFDTLEYNDESKVINNISILFPTKRYSVINEIFDLCGVPSGTDYEENLPEDLQYWPAILAYDISDDYQYFLNSSFSLENHRDMLEEIKDKIYKTDDELIKKSLLLTTMIFSEILLKSLISKKLPDTEEIDSINKKILNKAINKKLRGSIDDLRGFFKEVYGKTAPTLKWTLLRNSLTHEFNNCTIQGKTVSYKNQLDQIENYNLEVLFQEQEIFNSTLAEIIG